MRYLVLLVGFLSLWGCHRSSDEELIRARIAAMADAVEKHQVGTIDDALMAPFSAQQGQYDKKALLNWMRLLLLKNAAVTVSVNHVALKISGERADAQLTVLILGGPGGLIPEKGRLLNVESVWRKTGDGWQVYSAQWRDTL